MDADEEFLDVPMRDQPAILMKANTRHGRQKRSTWKAENTDPTFQI